MEDLPGDVPLNSSKPDCGCASVTALYLAVVDIVTLLTGQPVVVTLLWTTLTSGSTPDILNLNLILFHKSQYLVTLVHLCAVFSLPDKQESVFSFLLAYAQTGGPISLCFICVQRYVAVIHPTSYPLLKKHRYREVCVATVWFVSLSFSFAQVFEFLPATAKSFFHYFPFVVLMIMTAMVLHSSRETVKMLRKPGPDSERLHPAKRRALGAVRATSSIILWFYFPVTLMKNVRTVCHVDCMITFASFVLLSAASVVYPLFTLCSQTQLFCCCKGRDT